MKKHLNFRMRVILGAAAVLLSPRAPAATVTTVSDEFSLGYGFSTYWNTLEIVSPGVNTPTMIGHFAFVPAVNSSNASLTGPTFPDRVLTDGSLNGCGAAVDFIVSIAGTYNGPTPWNAAPNPNYQLKVVIDSISVCATPTVENSTVWVNWQETTAGHTASGPGLEVWRPYVAPINQAWGYRHLSWSPPSYDVAGTSAVRTFGLASSNNSLPSWVLDGFQVTGHVELTYDVPACATVALAGIGLLSSLRRKRQG